MTPLVLIVDDDADTRAMLQAALLTEGLGTMLASDGLEALAQLARTRPDLVLLDAIMPGLDGFETCRRVKQLDGMVHVPVIFMTGLSDTEHVVRGLSAGGVDYVTKPLVIDELIARIQVHLANARHARNAMTALDTAGARLIAVDGKGRQSWATPAATRLLDDLAPVERAAVAEQLRSLPRDLPGSETMLDFGPTKVDITYLGPASAEEHLFSLIRSVEGMDAAVLQEAYALTPREADVLLWIARGKTNRDASEILNISARTVNKHLDQIFVKMGVENRAAAAAAATRALLARR